MLVDGFELKSRSKNAGEAPVGTAARWRGLAVGGDAPCTTCFAPICHSKRLRSLENQWNSMETA